MLRKRLHDGQIRRYRGLLIDNVLYQPNSIDVIAPPVGQNRVGIMLGSLIGKYFDDGMISF